MILLSFGVMIFSMICIILSNSDTKVLSIVALCLTMCFLLLEVIITIKGWKKEPSLYKIAYNPNGVMNNVPLIAVIVGTLLGIGLLILSLVLYFTKNGEPYLTASLVILSITTYLLVNCIDYYIFVIMYKNRPLKLKDLIK